MEVIKRDGRKVPFDGSKIKDAVAKAYREVYPDMSEKDVEEWGNVISAKIITNHYPNENADDVDIEDIQNNVEKCLMNYDKDVVKAYITYRYRRELARNEYKALMKDVKEKLSAENVQNQNANIDEHSFGGRIGETADLVMKRYALDYCMSDMARNNHLKNEIYIHDLSHYAVGNHNCTDGKSWINISRNGEPLTIQIEELANSVGLGEGQIAELGNANYQILSRDGWTKLINITKRKVKPDEEIYTIKTRTGLPLKLTSKHRLPIIRDGVETIVNAENLCVGDNLISCDNINLTATDISQSFLDLTKINNPNLDIRIYNMSALKSYLKYRYNITFAKYIENKFPYYNKEKNRHEYCLTLDEFLQVIDEYPITFDVISKLKIKSNGSKHSYPLLIPYSPQLAKLYAYVYSDGSVYVKESGSLYQLSFANTNEEIIDDFISCFESVFGRKLTKCYPSKEYSENNSPCIRVHCGDKIIVQIFREFAGGLMRGSGNLSIPDFVMNGTDEVKYAYLSAAIDCDGCLSSAINISTCCEKYCEQLILILNSLGYHATKVKADECGAKYHFRKSNRTGTRNFDSYKVVIHRDDEKFKLYQLMSTIKNTDQYSYKGISHNFAEDKIISITKSHENIYVYDLETASHWFVLNNYISHNCLSVPFDDLLANGFNTRQTDVRPAQSVSTAFQLVAVIFQLQSLQQFGGVSATHLDWTMVPYVRKSFAKHFKDGLIYIAKQNPDEWFNLGNSYLSIDDNYYKSNNEAYTYAMDMTIKEIYQAVEGMYHNLNTLQSRSGNQLPFTSINYGTCALPEGRLITKALLEVSIKGIGKLHKTSIFPCGIFQCMTGINRKEGDPNYDLFKLALKSTAQRLYPNYANVDWSGNRGYDINDPRTYFSTMGCRTANGYDINGFGQLKDGRGNICPVTIILPTLAMEAVEPIYGEETKEDNIEIFMRILDEKIHEAKDMLIERFEWICSQNPKSAKFMYENNLMAGYDGKDIRSALKHGTLALGQLGLAETLQILIGKNHTTDEGMELAKRIESLFKTRCAEFKEQYKLNFGVYYTPAENLCYTAMQKFKAKYGVIPNVSDKEFFTNSIHVPVWEHMTPFEKIDIESQLTGYSSAGCITYVELESTVKHNIEALETLVNYAMDKDIPYFAINVPNDMCQNCGYTDEINSKCPMCECPNIRRLRRVTGYLTGDYTSAFNLGKQQEVEMRVKHK